MPREEPGRQLDKGEQGGKTGVVKGINRTQLYDRQGRLPPDPSFSSVDLTLTLRHGYTRKCPHALMMDV